MTQTLITALSGNDDLSQSSRQSRTRALDELAESIKLQGVLEPVLVRAPGSGAAEPSPTEPWEILAGLRRVAAATLAGLTEVPTLALGPMTDVEAMEIRIVENLHREDVHPLDEAEAYALFLPGTPVNMVARRVSKTTAYVHRRHALMQLTPDCRAAYRMGEITTAHAERLARLSEDDQGKAIHACRTPRLHGLDDEGREYEPSPQSELTAWLELHTQVDPAALAIGYYFPEFGEALEDAQIDGASLLPLSESMMPGADLQDKKHGLLGARRWTEITTTDTRCDHTRRGVVVHGGPMRILDVCAKKGCPTHRPPPAETTGTEAETSDSRQQEARTAEESSWEKSQRAREAWDAALDGAFEAFAAHVAEQPITAALVTQVLGLNHGRVTKITGVAVTETNLGQALAVSVALDSWDRPGFVKKTKPFGFKLPRAKKAPEEKAAKKKKPAEGSS